MSAESIEIDFDTPEAALETYFGPDGSGGNGNDGTNGDGTPGEADWGEPQEADHNFIGGWGLFYQPNLEEEGVRRWFVIRVTNSGQFQALNMSGVAEDYPDDASFEELPHTLDRAEAEAAYETWLENADESDIEEGEGGPGRGDDSEDGDDEQQWSEWQEIAQESGWFIFRRQHLREDREQFFAAGENAEGQTVFLGPEGEIRDEEHIFEELAAVQAAIDAYVQRMENGETDPGQMPTGAPPGGPGMPGQESRPPGSNLPLIGPAAQAAGGLGNLLLLVGAVVVIGYYLESRGHIDLTDRFGPENGEMDADTNGGLTDE